MLTKKQIFAAAKTRAGAIACSIQHWEEIASLDRGKVLVRCPRLLTTDYCALCLRYFNKDCIGCPLRSEYGQSCCKEFQDARNAVIYGEEHRELALKMVERLKNEQDKI